MTPRIQMTKLPDVQSTSVVVRPVKVRQAMPEINTASMHQSSLGELRKLLYTYSWQDEFQRKKCGDKVFAAKQRAFGDYHLKLPAEVPR